MHRTILILLFFINFSSFALEIKGFKADKKVEYKKTAKSALKLHMFFPKDYDPKKDSRPAIVFFFGGGWSGGSPSQFYPFSKHLADKGIIAIAAEYRTKKSHGTNPDTCIKDGKSAIRWVRAHAKEYGIDPKRLAAGGGSAGGHVAAATGTATSITEKGEDGNISSWPNALVLFNPVLDNGPKGYGHSRVKEYWQSFSPMHNIDKNIPPSIFFLGTKDTLIPVKTGEKWNQLVKAQGQKSELHLWDGQTHGFFNHGKTKGANGGKVYNEILAKMDAFLIKIGFLQKD
jgi:acetyl esterase